jgi:hypothetical protein
LKLSADELIGEHIADGSLVRNAEDEARKAKALKALRQINKARKAERRAWDAFSDYLEEDLAEA